ncbi:ATP phosphoribosyltransferase [Candidatus Nitrospira neomarina]|uniref:ATP phosphoribosyltransferase n=1 Tax=Candidatus Nitrospira neomarina TaxID=3020899 RepID=A0AA96GIU4_9BACT|nr:ATP phosphoribosyltransferase [Candidatus Nitrospira neomarina]WNM61742.1 ATP phosphoribosyltransferase [Candidatus Nitrospira neomarina]
MSEGITIALSKGKLLDPTLELFRQAGYTGYHVRADDRRLILEFPEHGHRVLIVRPSDVPAYVEYGAADLGVVGKDVLLEQSPDVYEPVDLNLGVCRLVVARPNGPQLVQRMSSKLRVATKYPTITERYFNQQGLPVELIKLYGSIELAPLVGLADRIVDLVETGNTLKANNLVEDGVIAWSSARLIVNRASLKMKHAVITELIARMKKILSRSRSKKVHA